GGCIPSYAPCLAGAAEPFSEAPKPQKQRRGAMNTIEKAGGRPEAGNPDRAADTGDRVNAHSAVMTFGADEPLALDSGVSLSPFTIAYETYGTLNADKSNVVLICHALTLDQYAASTHPLTGKPGWWPFMVGPGLPI